MYLNSRIYSVTVLSHGTGRREFTQKTCCITHMTYETLWQGYNVEQDIVLFQETHLITNMPFITHK